MFVSPPACTLHMCQVGLQMGSDLASDLVSLSIGPEPGLNTYSCINGSHIPVHFQ
jgi:hypothetical protein